MQTKGKTATKVETPKPQTQDTKKDAKTKQAQPAVVQKDSKPTTNSAMPSKNNSKSNLEIKNNITTDDKVNHQTSPSKFAPPQQDENIQKQIVESGNSKPVISQMNNCSKETDIKEDIIKKRHFDTQLFKIERSDFFPSVINEKREPIPTVKPNAALNSLNISTHSIIPIRILKKSINRHFLLKRKDNDRVINLRSKKLTSQRPKQGISIFSQYQTMLETLNSNEAFSTAQSPLSNTSKLIIEKNFNNEKSQLTQPIKGNSSDQFKYLNTLKQSTLSIKSENQLITKPQPLVNLKQKKQVSNINFDAQYKNILDNQKLKPKSGKFSTADEKLSFIEKAILTSRKIEGRQSNISYIVIGDSARSKEYGANSVYFNLGSKRRW